MGEVSPSTGPQDEPAVLEYTAPPQEEPLRHRAIRASLWVIASQPLTMVIQMARSMILTRLLAPEAFGLMTLVQVILQGLQMCSDIGIGPSIVRHKDKLDERFLQTIWTVQIVRMLALCGVAVLLAWPAAQFYGQPMLLALIPMCGLNMVVGSLRSTVTDIMNRQLQQARLLRFNYTMTIAGNIVMIAIAYWTRSVWALVLGTTAEWAFYSIFSHFLAGSVRHRFRWDKEVIRELSNFGRWILVGTLLTFLAQQQDRLLLGKLVPATVLGVYGIAMVLVMRPRDLIIGLSGSILFPVLSEHVRDNPAGLNQRVLKARGMLLLLGACGMAAAGLGAQLFFEIFYDSRYWDAGWMVQLSLLAMWAAILQKSGGYALLAFGDSRNLAISNGVQIICSAAGAIAGSFCNGVPGFILGLGIGSMLAQIWVEISLRRHGIGIVMQDVLYTVGAGVYIGAGLLCLHLFADDGHTISGTAHTPVMARLLGAWKSMVIITAFLLPVGIGAMVRVWPMIRRRRRQPPSHEAL